MKIKLIRIIVVLLVLLSCQKVSAQNEKKNITLDDIFKKRTFSSKGAGNIQSMKDGENYCQLKNDSLNVFGYENGNLVETIVTASGLIPKGDTTPIEMGDFRFSEDESRILFATDEEPIYRYSSKANYYIFDRQTKNLTFLSKLGKQRLMTLSPDGSKVSFVRDNNLYLMNIAADQSGNIDQKEIQLTFDGKQNEVIYGATDWVYEEEFGFTQAYFWSPDSKKIAFYRFDESKVREYQLAYYGDLYPEHYKYKYPKAGEANSLVGIHIYHLENQKTIKADAGNETDIYIPRIKWTNEPDKLAIFRMNRHQNKLEILLVNANDGASSVILTENNKYYIDITDHLTFLKNGREFLFTSEKEGYRHIYLYNMEGKLIRQLTRGNWEVVDLLGVDEQAGLVYFSSTETSPLNRDISAVSLNGKKLLKIAVKNGTNVATFSSSCKYFLWRWSDINTPPYYAICDNTGKEIRRIQDNAKLQESMVAASFSKADFFQFRTKDSLELNGFMLKPPDFDPQKKYPVLFTIYGGPGSQTVTNSWGAISTWNQLWAQNGIIVVSVDNRGTGGRGEEFKKCTYLQLGKYETLDQVDAAKYLSTLPHIDKSRIGMWGWSFGGYLTLSCLTRGADYFSFGVAVAPVTNWKYYDNIYTERFMRTPKENPDGYESNSPVSHASEFKGKLLMIHGMADDNVHPQNAYDMFSALVAAGKKFDSEFYPNSNHGIYAGKGTTYHLYMRMTNFILENL